MSKRQRVSCIFTHSRRPGAEGVEAGRGTTGHGPAGRDSDWVSVWRTPFSAWRRTASDLGSISSWTMPWALCYHSCACLHSLRLHGNCGRSYGGHGRPGVRPCVALRCSRLQKALAWTVRWMHM